MNGPRDDHIKWYKSERDKYHIIPFVGEIENIAQMNISMKQKQTLRHREQTCGCQGGGGREREREFGLADANDYTQNENQQGPTV